MNQCKANESDLYYQTARRRKGAVPGIWWMHPHAAARVTQNALRAAMVQAIAGELIMNTSPRSAPAAMAIAYRKKSATACCATPTGCWPWSLLPTVLGAWLGVATGITESLRGGLG